MKNGSDNFIDIKVKHEILRLDEKYALLFKSPNVKVTGYAPPTCVKQLNKNPQFYPQLHASILFLLKQQEHTQISARSRQKRHNKH
jgi:hypothetical protein